MPVNTIVLQVKTMERGAIIAIVITDDAGVLKATITSSLPTEVTNRVLRHISERQHYEKQTIEKYL